MSHGLLFVVIVDVSWLRTRLAVAVPPSEDPGHPTSDDLDEDGLTRTDRMARRRLRHTRSLGEPFGCGEAHLFPLVPLHSGQPATLRIPHVSGVNPLAGYRHSPQRVSNTDQIISLAALKKYGLLVDDGKGTARRASLTDLAVDILKNPDPRVRDEALQRAALNPSIHRELWEKYGNAPRPMSDANLRWILTRERGFTETGAAEFIPVYKDTVSFAKLD